MVSTNPVEKKERAMYENALTVAYATQLALSGRTTEKTFQ